MTRYNASQLVRMARVVQDAKDRGDERYLQFILQLSVRAGVSPAKCMDMVELMAKGKDFAQ